MKRPHPSLPALLLIAACAACGGGHEVDISTITNESAHEAATEVERETEQAHEAMDTLPSIVADSLKAEQEERKDIIHKELSGSPYARMSDAGLDSVRRAWLTGYTRSCDPAEFKRIIGTLQKDAVFKQWSTNHVDTSNAYWDRLYAAKKVCGGTK